MRLTDLLALPATLAAVVCASALQSSTGSYAEHLHLRPLSGGALYAGFNFTASTRQAAYESQHFQYFPRSLGQILQFTNTAELHLRFALGRWDEESWGSRPRNGRREGGTGVELWAWIEAATREDAEKHWDDLANSLSGLFCASLNFIDQTKTIHPILTFEPEGTFASPNASLHLMHGVLPHEVVCTENLTPFLKLLPCKGKAGISSLLDGHKIFDADWQTMAIDVRPICASAAECDLEISQTVDMVLDLDRSMRSRNDPIPRPPPIEDIACDESKSYNSPDTSYPKALQGHSQWSLSRVFGRAMPGSCPVGDRSNALDISLDIPADGEVETIAELISSHADHGHTTMQYRLPEGVDVDISLPSHGAPPSIEGERSLIRASRQITGYGQERGGMHAVITNPHSYAQRIVYLESLPWFLRPYMHTLSVKGAAVEKMYYTPAIDRRKGTQLELLLEVPAFSTVDLTYDFEKAILRYTEYPPDANRGFDVAPAVIRVLPSSGEDDSQGHYLRTTSLLLPLPTPDFSMPYNVIILTSTVIALGFGSIFNLLTRRFVLLEEVPASPLAGIVGKVRGVVAKVKGRFKAVADTEDSAIEKSSHGPAASDKVGDLPRIPAEQGNGGVKKRLGGRATGNLDE